MKLNDQLFAYIWRNYQANNCNTFIVQSGKTTCLIDPGLKTFLPQLFKLMGQDGIHPEAVNVVILTHCHPDHMEGALQFQQLGARVGIHKEDERFIREVGPSFAAMLGMQLPDITFDFYIDEGELQLGGEAFKVLHTPGHSPGEIVLFWEVPRPSPLLQPDIISTCALSRRVEEAAKKLIVVCAIQRDTVESSCAAIHIGATKEQAPACIGLVGKWLGVVGTGGHEYRC